jgi:hypothetical protein
MYGMVCYVCADRLRPTVIPRCTNPLLTALEIVASDAEDSSPPLSGLFILPGLKLADPTLHSHD